MTVSIETTGVGPNQASGVGPVPLDKPTNRLYVDVEPEPAGAEMAHGETSA
jgi:hypothetical protein